MKSRPLTFKVPSGAVKVKYKEREIWARQRWDGSWDVYENGIPSTYGCLAFEKVFEVME
jgi:hypothetical protein